MSYQDPGLAEAYVAPKSRADTLAWCPSCPVRWGDVVLQKFIPFIRLALARWLGFLLLVRNTSASPGKRAPLALTTAPAL